MDDEQKPAEPTPGEQADEFIRRLREAQGVPAMAPRCLSKAALEAAIPSLTSVVLTAVGFAAVGILSHRMMRKTIVGDKTSYERYERHTPHCHEIYERFEQGTILVQRG